MKVVPVRLNDRTIERIDFLVNSGIYSNRSEALRKIIEVGVKEIEAETNHLKRIDEIVDKIMNVELNFEGRLSKALKEGRDRW